MQSTETSKQYLPFLEKLLLEVLHFNCYICAISEYVNLPKIILDILLIYHFKVHRTFPDIPDDTHLT